MKRLIKYIISELKSIIKLIMLGFPIIALFLGLSLIPFFTSYFIMFILFMHSNKGARGLGTVSDSKQIDKIRNEVLSSSLVLVATLPLIIGAIMYFKQAMSIVGVGGVTEHISYIVIFTSVILTGTLYRKNNKETSSVMDIKSFSTVSTVASFTILMCILHLEAGAISRKVTDNSPALIMKNKISIANHIER